MLGAEPSANATRKGSVRMKISANEQQAVESLGRRFAWEDGHVRQVLRLALRLFDEIVPAGSLPDAARRWLWMAAMLHDIGWIDGQKGHHKTSCQLILADRTLELDDRTRAIVASVARYHRKALPKLRHEPYGQLSEVDRQTVCLLAGLLRLADGLDRTHTDVVRDVTCRLRDDGLDVECLVRGNADAERAAAEKKGDLLSAVLGRAVRIGATPVGTNA